MPRQVRTIVARDQQIQSNLYGGYDISIYQVPRAGRDAFAILQKCTFLHSQNVKCYPGSKVSEAVKARIRIEITIFHAYSLPQIYEEFYHTINNADHQKDLKWWSNNHGVNMAMNWPSFIVSFCLYGFHGCDRCAFLSIRVSIVA